jgi:hypothetical protein
MFTAFIVFIKFMIERYFNYIETKKKKTILARHHIYPRRDT